MWLIDLALWVWVSLKSGKGRCTFIVVLLISTTAFSLESVVSSRTFNMPRRTFHQTQHCIPFSSSVQRNILGGGSLMYKRTHKGSRGALCISKGLSVVMFLSNMWQMSHMANIPTGIPAGQSGRGQRDLPGQPPSCPDQTEGARRRQSSDTRWGRHIITGKPAVPEKLLFRAFLFLNVKFFIF